MNITHKDFIGIYENALDVENCKKIISKFELIYATNPSEIVLGKDQTKTESFGRKDYSIFIHGLLPDESFLINDTLNKCLQIYSDEYFSLKQVKAVSTCIKLQKTPPRGGYHVWHSEANCRSYMERVLTWTIYLNDVPDGEGETEFLWQGIKVAPKSGTCCIFPAQFTHPHRGNPVYSCDKYIATGWYTYTE